MITDKLFYSRGGFRVGRWFLVIVILLILLALFFWGQQNSIKTQTVEVTSSELPAAFDGLRIVQLSDLHGKEMGLESETLLREVAQMEPDLIAITGDLVDQESQLDVAYTLVKQLVDIAPTYYVTGNHEWASTDVKKLKQTLTGYGVKVLTNQYEVWEKDGATLAIAGVDDPNGPADQKTGDILRQEISADYTILLAHRNTVEEYADWGYDLVLCGHGHGGVIRIPIVDVGVLGTNREFFPDYDAGLYSFEQGGSCFVSRGLGSNTVPYPAFRLFNRPDLPLIILHTGD